MLDFYISGLKVLEMVSFVPQTHVTHNTLLTACQHSRGATVNTIF